MEKDITEKSGQPLSSGHRSGGVTDAVWDFFGSLKLAISLLIFISATSVIGTVIPQNPDDETVMGFIQEHGEASYNRFEALGFFDLYHQWYFLLSLALLMVNLIVCSLDMFPRTMKRYKDAKPEPDEKYLKGMRFSESFKIKGKEREGFLAHAEKILSVKIPQGADPDAGPVYLFSNKGGLSRFGVYFVHLSIIVIIVGSLIGTVFGFRGGVNIAEGTKTDTIYLFGQQKGRELKLPFEIRCDDFELETYEGTSQAKDFRSALVIIEDGKEVLSKTIEVNDPLRYKGITFYQSSYGETGQGSKLQLLLEVSGGEKTEIKVPPNQMLEVTKLGKVMFAYSGDQGNMGGHSSNHFVVVNIYKEDGTVKQDIIYPEKPAIFAPPPESVTLRLEDADGNLIKKVVAGFNEEQELPGGRFSPGGKFKVTDYNPDFQGMGPSISIDIHPEGGKSNNIKLFKNYPDFDRKNRKDQKIYFVPEEIKESEGETITLSWTGVDTKYFTGLQVAKDPGVPVVWAGCIIMFLGLYLSFFSSHRKIWVRTEGNTVLVAGSTHRNPMAFESRFRALVEKLRQFSDDFRQTEDQ